MPAPLQPEELEARLATIRSTALDLFAMHGFRSTSMAAIADAAGLSRPALYQHYENREAIFRAALAELLERANTAALAELQSSHELIDRLDGYLQRCRGDVIGPLLGSAHGEELLDARSETASDLADRLHATRRRALDRLLVEETGGDRELARRTADLLELGPLGLKHDSPSPRTYRKRLSALAEAAAAAIDARRA